ncbi:hypothetical protein [Bacillus thuringiensis]|uniref:hypothetical protein n=1 Tax=Bacillus thuringiensis TaxID=1428 RepID=UPI00314526A5|nr:hypothetical protein [Bacillus cereus]
MSVTNITNEFQKDVAQNLSKLFEKKIVKLEREDRKSYLEIIAEYQKQISFIRNSVNNSIANELEIHKNWLSCLAEPITEYNLSDINRELDSNTMIYSPRMDIAITPTLVKRRGKRVSMGIYRLSEDVKLINYIYKLDFIKQMEFALRRQSNRNLERFNLNHLNDPSYINNRPMHLFGIEIENQKNPKHLMGDFLNAISLSKIPIILFPEDKMEGCMKMLLFSSLIKSIKDVPIFDIINIPLVLTISQFRDIMNHFLEEENLDLIRVEQYR